MPKPCVMVSIYTRSAPRASLEENVHWWGHLSLTEVGELLEEVRAVLRNHPSGRFEVHASSQEGLDQATERANKHEA